MNLTDIESIRIDFREVNPAGTRSFIETPIYFKNKRCAINPKNKDNKCFKYALVMPINRNKLSSSDPGAISKKFKQLCKNYNWEGINFPPTTRDYNLSETNNPNVALVLFEYEGDDDDGKITDTRISKYVGQRKHQGELLIIRENNKEDIESTMKKHFLTITKVNILLKKERYNKTFICCIRCYNHFWSIESLKENKGICDDIELRRSEIPETNKTDIVKFNNHTHSFMQPFNAEADFETYYDEKECEKPFKFTIKLFV